MNSVIVDFVHGLLQAAAIWLALLAVAVIALSIMLGRPKRERLPEEHRARGALLKRARLSAQYEQLERFAGEVSVAAERAAAIAERRRKEWLTVQSHAQIAWEAYEACDAEARRLGAAAPTAAAEDPVHPGRIRRTGKVHASCGDGRVQPPPAVPIGPQRRAGPPQRLGPATSPDRAGARVAAGGP